MNRVISEQLITNDVVRTDRSLHLYVIQVCISREKRKTRGPAVSAASFMAET